MWPGFDSQTRRHMWVEFVGSLLCTEKFSPGTPVSPHFKKQHLTYFAFIVYNLQFTLFSVNFTVSPISAPVLERLDT